MGLASVAARTRVRRSKTWRAFVRVAATSIADKDGPWITKTGGRGAQVGGRIGEKKNFIGKTLTFMSDRERGDTQPFTSTIRTELPNGGVGVGTPTPNVNKRGKPEKLRGAAKQ